MSADSDLTSEELRILQHITETVSSSLDLDFVLRKIVDLVIGVTKSDSCLIYLLDQTRDVLVLRASSNPNVMLNGRMVMRIGDGLSTWTEQSSIPVGQDAVHEPFGVFPEIRENDVHAFLSVPIISPAKRLVGIINVRHPLPHRYTERERTLLSIIGHQVAGSIENARLYRRTTKMASKLKNLNRRLRSFAFRDSLTGLFNRRYFQEALDRELVRAARYGHPLALILVDVDHFKEINDRHGHLRGDGVLKAIAHRVLASSRDTDIVSRYGGEEFAMLLPETDLSGASAKAEACRASIEATEIQIDDTVIRVMISLGIAAYDPARPIDKSALIDAADSALYESKRTGRNRVSVAGLPGAVSPEANVPPKDNPPIQADSATSSD